MTPLPSLAAPSASAPFLLHPRNIAATVTREGRRARCHAGARPLFGRCALGLKSLIWNDSKQKPSSAESVGKLNRKGCNAPGTVFDCIKGSQCPAAHAERFAGATGVDV
jgi:hypothetical protein